jgi:hypothetical protein
LEVAIELRLMPLVRAFVERLRVIAQRRGMPAGGDRALAGGGQSLGLAAGLVGQRLRLILRTTRGFSSIIPRPRARCAATSALGFCNGIFVKRPVSRFEVEHNTCVGGISFGCCASYRS